MLIIDEESSREFSKFNFLVSQQVENYLQYQYKIIQNFNNRTEEAMGSALDLWTAFREGAFNGGVQPFLGYFFMLEECEASMRPVRVKEPHFKVFPEFVGASYMQRYELFCRKLVLERHYTSVSFITSESQSGLVGIYNVGHMQVWEDQTLYEVRSARKTML